MPRSFPELFRPSWVRKSREMPAKFPARLPCKKKLKDYTDGRLYGSRDNIDRLLFGLAILGRVFAILLCCSSTPLRAARCEIVGDSRPAILESKFPKFAPKFAPNF